MSEKIEIDKKEYTVFDLPLSLREIIYKEITEGLSEMSKPENNSGLGFYSKELPMTYIIGEESIMAILYTVDENHEPGDVITMNIGRNNLERLIK